MKRLWFVILPVLVFVISCADLVATLNFERNHSGFNEANPIARYVWNVGGDMGLIAFKLSVTLLSCTCMGLVLRYKKRPWQIAVSVFGLSGCILLIGWWIFWFFSGTIS